MEINESEAKKLGLKDEDFEIEKFISANSQELAKVGKTLILHFLNILIDWFTLGYIVM